VRKGHVPLRIKTIFSDSEDVLDGNSVQASAGLLILKSRAYSGYPEMFAGNGLFAG
jgi:hypothetical protein